MRSANFSRGVFAERGVSTSDELKEQLPASGNSGSMHSERAGSDDCGSSFSDAGGPRSLLGDVPKLAAAAARHASGDARGGSHRWRRRSVFGVRHAGFGPLCCRPPPCLKPELRRMNHERSLSRSKAGPISPSASSKPRRAHISTSQVCAAI